MLRISFIKSESGGVLLQLQGRLVGPWVDEFRTTVLECQQPLPLLQLDLAHLQFVDALGVAALQQLQNQGVQIMAISPFIQELLLTRNT